MDSERYSSGWRDGLAAGVSLMAILLFSLYIVVGIVEAVQWGSDTVVVNQSYGFMEWAE